MRVEPSIPPFHHPQATWNDLSQVRHWGFFTRDDVIHTAGALLMLDIDFGRSCSLRCPTCFRRNNAVDDSGLPDLTYDEILTVIEQARPLGLRTVKICGAGEPLENPDLLRLGRQLTAWGVGLAIFTKGHTLGDDGLCQTVFAHEGIRNTHALAAALFDLETSVLVSFQSFCTETQDHLVGQVLGHSLRRNRALEELARAGFNKVTPTRMAVCANPITRDNYSELLEIYVWCRERNILPVVAALMTSGKQLRDAFLDHVDVTAEEKIALYQRVYRYNIDCGIQSKEELAEEGVSPMPGIHPCNQIASGLYVTCNGTVVPCPGDSTILGNVRDLPLREIWLTSPCYRRRGTYNCKCPPKAGRTLPEDLYERVLDLVLDDRSTPDHVEPAI